MNLDYGITAGYQPAPLLLLQRDSARASDRTTINLVDREKTHAEDSERKAKPVDLEQFTRECDKVPVKSHDVILEITRERNANSLGEARG